MAIRITIEKRYQQMDIKNLLIGICSTFLLISCREIPEKLLSDTEMWTVDGWKGDLFSNGSFEVNKQDIENNQILNSLLGLDSEETTIINLGLEKNGRFFIDHNNIKVLDGNWINGDSTITLLDGNTKETFGLLKINADSILLTHKGEGSLRKIKITLKNNSH
ncbi:hypothetical protein GU926_17675 [Nibribacter ruber]|uniref:Lipocalin-like domain-containing protein n=1 Tax=Nibribacter ruber TaxID=2698458 RepID=A0A6P1P449_9BACT|nr:hypothetical protein [Nibribacter ruber]QHL89162.1 hypothetical protein GU926_17675 [Nibribacter ruber]